MKIIAVCMSLVKSLSILYFFGILLVSWPCSPFTREEGSDQLIKSNATTCIFMFNHVACTCMRMALCYKLYMAACRKVRWGFVIISCESWFAVGQKLPIIMKDCNYNNYTSPCTLPFQVWWSHQWLRWCGIHCVEMWASRIAASTALMTGTSLVVHLYA